MGIRIKKKEFKNVQPGKYFAVVESIEAGEGQFGPQLIWKFQILHRNPELNGSVVSGLSGVMATPKAKLSRWILACGVNFVDEIDTDELVGKKVVITVVENRTSRNGQEMVWSNVTNVESIDIYQGVSPSQQPIINSDSPSQKPIK